MVFSYRLVVEVEKGIEETNTSPTNYRLVVHVINYGGCRDVALQRLY